MDQLKPVLAVLKKYHFWALEAVVVVMTLTLWQIATADLEGRYKKREGQVRQKFDDLQAICENPKHPNDKYIESTGNRTEDQEKVVFVAWETVYSKQKDDNRLPGGLAEGFKDAFWADGDLSQVDGEEQLQLYLQFYGHRKAARAQLSQLHRSDYWNFIQGHFETLFKGLDLRRPAEEQEELDASGGNAIGGANVAGPGNEAVSATNHDGVVGPTGAPPTTPGKTDSEVKMVGILEWKKDNKSRGRLLEKFRWPSLPSDLQVRLAQEDLWVYEALLRVIKNTNVGALSHDKAAVKRIEALQIGQDVVGAAEMMKHGAGGTVWQVSGAGGNSGQSYDGFVGPAQQPQQPAPGQTGEQARTEEQELLDHRYVDDKGQPLAAGQKHPFAEYKIMPIRMNLVMNQTKIPRLLAECANSTMPIEVRRVRLNPGQGSSFDFTPADATTGGGRAAAPHRPRRPTAPRPLLATLGTSDEKPGQMDISVEIEGIICIYNPPDKEELGTGTAAEKPAEGAAPGEPPAPPPAAPPAPPPAGGPRPLPGVPPATPPGTLPATGPAPPGGPPGAGPGVQGQPPRGGG